MPAMAGKKHVVREGESVQSIAEKHGFAWETLWKHPENAELKKSRRDPDVLHPGDVLVIPEKAQKKESRATEDRHSFKKKGAPTWLRLTFLEEEQPRKGAPYRIRVGGKSFEGKLDAEGRVDLQIPTRAQEAHVQIGSDEELLLQLAALDPIEEVSGYQARLQNLGFYLGAVDGKHGPLTEEAIRAFQANKRLEVSGELDDDTRTALEKAHGDKD